MQNFAFMIILMFGICIFIPIKVYKNEMKNFEKNKKRAKAEVVGYIREEGDLHIGQLKVTIPELNDGKHYGCHKNKYKQKIRLSSIPIGTIIDVEYAPYKFMGLKTISVQLIDIPEEYKNELKMVYDRKVFNKYYGKPYWDKIKQLLITNAFLLTPMFLLDIKTKPIFALLVLVLLIAFAISAIRMVLAINNYYKEEKISENQKQWFDENKLLHVLLIPKEAFSWSKTNFTYTEEYVFNKISNISVEDKYIVIQGNIELIKKKDEMTEIKEVSVCKIPRSFTHEEWILNLKGE